MALSWTIDGYGFKSPPRVLCRSLWQSRRRWKTRAARLRQKVARQQEEIEALQRRERRLRSQLEEARRAAQDDRSRRMAPAIDQGPLVGHQFSAAMIALCVTLSLRIGFRAVPDVLRLFAEASGLPLKIPSRDVVRNWACRNGVAILQEATRADDWVWMVDHSVQLGKMFVLVVLGIRRCDLPADRPLRRVDMTPLAVMPTTSRSKDEVERQLAETAQHLGTPLAILSDEAAELQEGVRALESSGFAGPHLHDVKHKIANVLKKMLTGDERFEAFSREVGKTTAAIQQTELEHLLPPRKKTKCRFMGFDRLIDWATMIEHRLNTPADGDGESSSRLEEKLGWIRQFKDDLCQWKECRQLVGATLTEAAKHGVADGSTAELRRHLEDCGCDTPLAIQLRRDLVTIYQVNEDRLIASGLGSCRLPCSTEVLESAFGSFKALQRTHCGGTFTSLLAAFGSLFSENTPEQIARRFSNTSNSDLRAWLNASNLSKSTQARRTAAYAAAKPRKTVSPMPP